MVDVCRAATFTEFDTPELRQLLDECLDAQEQWRFQKDRLVEIIIDKLHLLESNPDFNQKLERVASSVAATAVDWGIEAPRPIVASMSMMVVAVYYVEALIASGVLEIEER